MSTFKVRSGEMLTSALRQIAEMGWIRPEEIRWIARLSDRMSARAYARRIGGKPGAAALRAYQQTMTEVAFLHNRAVNGTAPPDVNQRMNLLLQRAALLRPYVVFPPPPPTMVRPDAGQPGPWHPPSDPRAPIAPDQRFP